MEPNPETAVIIIRGVVFFNCGDSETGCPVVDQQKLNCSTDAVKLQELNHFLGNRSDLISCQLSKVDSAPCESRTPWELTLAVP